ncbi:uncharacterized protein [Amphiura filiformis]|uniref:uncharacterized protein n=1 Tax=Amphiura filiformis TaxID=82378 RepID=UPI003B219693
MPPKKKGKGKKKAPDPEEDPQLTEQPQPADDTATAEPELAEPLPEQDEPLPEQDEPKGKKGKKGKGKKKSKRNLEEEDPQLTEQPQPAGDTATAEPESAEPLPEQDEPKGKKGKKGKGKKKSKRNLEEEDPQLTEQPQPTAEPLTSQDDRPGTASKQGKSEEETADVEAKPKSPEPPQIDGETEPDGAIKLPGSRPASSKLAGSRPTSAKLPGSRPTSSKLAGSRPTSSVEFYRTVEVEKQSNTTAEPKEDGDSEKPQADDAMETEEKKPRLHMSGGDDVGQPETDLSMHTVNMEGVADDVDPKEYGIDMEPEPEYQYEPPSQENLPDLTKLMDELDGGESDLEAERAPPELFKRPEHEPNYKTISSLKIEMEEEPIDPYITRFEDDIKDDVLMIGNISLEEVQEEERRLRDEHIAYQQQEAILARKRQEDILLREERAKRHVTKTMKDKRKELARMEELNIQRERLLQDQLHKTFKKSENQLLRSLEIRKGEVKTMYGDLMMADGQYGGSKGRRWKVDWNRAPQPVQIKIKCLRGVKDKLPAGRYVLMVSLYDRLGGHILRWSHLRGQEWGGATLPLVHDGKFHNVEVKVDQSLFTVCPSKPDVRPGMMVMFELFLLRGSLLPIDKVVSWGVFPICDEQFNIIQGKYKTPMLRGEMDPRIDRHVQVEKLLASDIDHWLCNVYFEVIKLPRYLVGQKEYEVELQFTSQLVNYPDRTKGAEEAIDGDAPIIGSQPDLNGSTGRTTEAEEAIDGDVVNYPDRTKGAEEAIDGDAPIMGSQPDLNGSTGGIQANVNSSQTSLSTGSSQGDNKASTSSDSGSVGKRQSSDSMGSQKSISDHSSIPKNKEDTDTDSMKGKLRYRGNANQQRGGGATQAPTTVYNSRKLLETAKGSRLDWDSDNSDDDDVRRLDDGFMAVKGEPGLYYKHHMNPPATDYMRRLYTMLPKTALLSQKKRRKKLTYLEQLDTHSFAVQKPFSTKGHIHREGQEKVQYVSRQLFSELGLSQWRSREFWTLLILLCLIFFMRVYLHYVGQWIFLNIINIPISKFEFLPYSVNLNYQSSLLHTREEVAVVILGPLMNILILALLVGSCWACQKVLGSFPDLFCKFVIVYGLHTFLDPVLIAIVDAPLGRYDYEVGDEPVADAAKLYFHFERTHGTGLMGILLTVPIYFFLMFFSGVIFYMYFLRLHNNGRMLDIYHRLHAPEDDFFIPYDLEISNQELSHICKNSEQWRGEEGERRKVAVYDYIWQEDDQDEEGYMDDDGESINRGGGKTEVTTHVSIHTLHLDGLRELHRHFLRLPDGGIVEVFGEMGVVGMDKDLKAALHQGASGMEKNQQPVTTNWMGSAESIMRPRPKTVGGIGSQDMLHIPATPGVNLGERIPSEASLGPAHPAVSLSKASSYSSLAEPKSPKLKERPSSGRPRSGVKKVVPTAGSADNITEL